ncbi:MATE family efflux transporter [Streptococcus loxodontisalivarius]|uniref:MATE family efflux protein n=1 Tax=Streptococcus loxodontisalivarius TaxID=1349415 RepID=A0ABS2PQU5_9STRE|nr:MATE family efflux transporter [Streptococcus loxodontisalivarius]MBM7642365.1 putative MATE family efflux protein [Streptococcus loxodontisalivarius]
MKSRAIDLTKGPVLKVLLLFAWPIMVSNLFQQLYNTADTMIVGHFLGEESLAAVGATSSIFDLIVGFALGIGNGLGIVIARYYGAGQKDMIKKSVASSLVIGLVLSFMVLLIGIFGLYPLLEFLGTPANIIDQSYDYISLIMMSVLVTFAYNLGAGLLRAIGDSLMALYILMFASLVNISLDLILITQAGMGVRGAAVATVTSQLLSALLCFAYIYKKAHILVPKRQHFSLDKALYRDLIGQGLSMGFMSSIVSIGTVILQSAINSLGVSIIAAQVTARRLMSFFIMPLTATATAIATFTSQNLGAGLTDRIRQGVKKASLVALVWGLISIVSLYTFGPFLIALISGSNKAELLTASENYLHFTTLFYPLLGVLFILRNCLQGLGQKITPLVSSIIELLGKILFVIFVIPHLGYWGVILCEPLIWIPMTLQLYWVYAKQSKAL